MDDREAANEKFRTEVAGRFGILPNFFRSAEAAPELIQELWGFAKAGYLENPMPSVFKERLFVWLSRFCPVRYCIVRHVGFLLGHGHGNSAGDPAAVPEDVHSVVKLLRRPTPWNRDMDPVYARLDALPAPLESWPESGSEMEDAIFACAAVMFVEPLRSERARRAVLCAIGPRNFEFFSGCLAFIRTAHYWTILHPEIETEDDMRHLMRGHEELAQLLLHDSEADRCDMRERLYEELTSLRELHERQELERAKQALEESHRKKDHFIAVLAHELRNPLATIRSSTDAMKLIGLEDPTAVRLIERMNRQTTAMARMLEDLLDASRIALGKMPVQLEPVDVNELLADVFDEQQPRFQLAHLRATTRLTASSCIVTADRIRVRQIVDNLLSNAIQFTPAGGTIELSCSRRGGFAVIEVRDSGIGFDPAFAETMFEPFTQQEQGRDRPAGGLGLGLAIATRLAKLQGGSLSARSAGANQGSLFTLEIPLAEAGGQARSETRTAARHARPTVLIVEDNKDVATGLAELLELTGIEVSLAFDGPSGVRMATELVPDVIICDLGLPGGMDGFAVARACRELSSLRNARLIAASGYSSPEDHATAKTAGFDCLLVKPLTLESLSMITHAE